MNNQNNILLKKSFFASLTAILLVSFFGSNQFLKKSHTISETNYAESESSTKFSNQNNNTLNQTSAIREMIPTSINFNSMALDKKETHIHKKIVNNIVATPQTEASIQKENQNDTPQSNQNNQELVNTLNRINDQQKRYNPKCDQIENTFYYPASKMGTTVNVKPIKQIKNNNGNKSTPEKTAKVKPTQTNHKINYILPLAFKSAVNKKQLSNDSKLQSNLEEKMLAKELSSNLNEIIEVVQKIKNPKKFNQKENIIRLKKLSQEGKIKHFLAIEPSQPNREVDKPLWPAMAQIITPSAQEKTYVELCQTQSYDKKIVCVLPEDIKPEAITFLKSKESEKNIQNNPKKNCLINLKKAILYLSQNKS
ncbi:MAG: hypothetical protein UR26_C0002G0176 [candidate division TM6 bacterium GW2011_GWF2_32_72]|nr:MAG: hypothetical protein UR26_C0002G0176 [candidate division TM6 bacterium GW2011_GWF2_32_72]